MNNGRCAACKYLRRRCPSDCIFSPYFPSNDPERFAFVHKIYGASNVGKVLMQVPTHLRAQVADSMYFEAQCRIQDPVYGCVRIISELHQQIQNVEGELAKVQAEITLLSSLDQNLTNERMKALPSSNDLTQDQGNDGQGGDSNQDFPWFLTDNSN